MVVVQARLREEVIGMGGHAGGLYQPGSETGKLRGFEAMQAIWNRLENQLQRLDPESWEHLRPGASDAALRLVEAFLPITLPEEVKALYQIHNGQAAIVNGWCFGSLKSLCTSWLFLGSDLELPGDHSNTYFACPTLERYPDYWHPHWLPFMVHFLGPNYCIDLAPGPNGKMGQILFYNNRHSQYPDPLSAGRPSIRVVAPGIREFFTALVNDLEAGVYAFDEETGILWSEEMYTAISALKTVGFYTDEHGFLHTETYLEGLKKNRLKEKASPLYEEYIWRRHYSWYQMYRDHPRWDREPPVFNVSLFPF